jgi:hypothetical protein
MRHSLVVIIGIGPRRALLMECHMRKVNVATAAQLLARNEGQRGGQKPFTPDRFFREVGILLAACLGLGLPAQVLVAIVGTQ